MCLPNAGTSRAGHVFAECGNVARTADEKQTIDEAGIQRGHICGDRGAARMSDEHHARNFPVAAHLANRLGDVRHNRGRVILSDGKSAVAVRFHSERIGISGAQHTHLSRTLRGLRHLQRKGILIAGIVKRRVAVQHHQQWPRSLENLRAGWPPAVDASRDPVALRPQIHLIRRLVRTRRPMIECAAHGEKCVGGDCDVHRYSGQKYFQRDSYGTFQVGVSLERACEIAVMRRGWNCAIYCAL